MSRSSGPRRLVIAGAAIAACAAFATPAQAVSKTLDYQCKYPILGIEPLSIKIDLDIPERWPSGVDTPPFAVSAVATAGGDTSAGLALIDDLTSIEGSALASATVLLPQGGSLKVNVPIQIPNYVIPTPTPDPLVLSASGSTPSLTFDEPGRPVIKLDRIALNLTARDSLGDPIVLPPVTRDINGVAVTPSDSDPNTFDVYCNLNPGQDTTLAEFEVGPPDCYECEAPTSPTEVNLRFEDFGPTSIRLRWGASTDNVGVTEYTVRYGDGKEVRVPASSAAEFSTLIEGLSPDSEYLFEITARDAAGAESDPLILLLVTFPAPPVLPGKVSGLTGTPGETSIELRWSASSDPDGTVASYNVYRGSTKVATVTGTSATVSGLTADTAYTFSVEAIDRSGLAGPRSEALTFKTLPPRVSPPRVTFTLKGSTSIKTLTKGNLPLAGSLDNVNLLLATGQLSGDLTLADTQGRLTALGFLPVTAKIGFVPSGRTTGTINDGVLNTKSFVRIKVKEVKLFGAIPLAGGNNCQTKSLSEINLQSTQPEFNPYQGGGPIAGTYRISDLNGCGVLNGLVSPLTAGGGNTINLNLTPKPAA